MSPADHCPQRPAPPLRRRGRDSHHVPSFRSRRISRHVHRPSTRHLPVRHILHVRNRLRVAPRLHRLQHLNPPSSEPYSLQAVRPQRRNRDHSFLE
jgi:hypothetical protein